MKPCDVVDTDDDGIHHLIGPAMLQEHLGLHYLNREISNAINPVLKASLGIKRLTTQHLIEIGKQETKKVISVTSDSLCVFVNYSASGMLGV